MQNRKNTKVRNGKQFKRFKGLKKKEKKRFKGLIIPEEW